MVVYLERMRKILNQVPILNSDLSGLLDDWDESKIYENLECHFGWFILFEILHL